MTTITTQQHWITVLEGRLFAQSWTPSGNAGSENSEGSAPIVMLHESLGSVALWRDFPAQLAQATGRRVVAYDRLGFGQSDARQGLPDLDFMAQEAVRYFPAVREQLQLASYVLLGHSVGGGMAVEIAARAGSECQAVITIAAQALVEPHTLAGIREARARFQEAEQLARLAKYHGDKARWVVDAWTETWLSPAFANWSLDNSLPQLTCPLLALHGELDEYGSTAQPARIARLAGGGGRCEILPGARHMPHREMPEQVLSHITPFLRGI